GLEGKMLIAAFASAAVAHAAHSAWIGLGAGILASVAFALLHGFASISQRGNQIVSGVAINLLAAGLTAVLGHALDGAGARPPPLDGTARFQDIVLPGAAALKNVPLIGPLYANVLSGNPAPVYLTLAAVALTSIVIAHTRFGLRLRAVGND